MIVSRRFRFEAAHRLPRHRGPCFELHGHSYVFHVSLDMPVDPETGMTFDFFELDAAIGQRILKRVDHKNLNDLIENPTAENIAIWIWDRLKPDFPALSEIRLFETPDSSVTYRGQ